MTATPLLSHARTEWRNYWPLVVATAMGMSIATVLSSVFGVMLEPLEQGFGWTRAEISSGPVVVSAMGLFLATTAGFLTDRLGSRGRGVLVVTLTFIAIAAATEGYSLGSKSRSGVRP